MKCKCCKIKFKPRYFNQKYCMDKDECIKAFVQIVKADKVKQDKKIWSRQKKTINDKLKTKEEWHNELQYWVNKFVKLRDKNEPCISCGCNRNDVRYDAGHFWPAGNYKFLRYHLDNIHKQCSFNCNNKRHGNVGEYRIRLVIKISQERVDWLDAHRHDKFEMSIEQIQEQIIIFKKMCKDADKN
jgi:NinG protein